MHERIHSGPVFKVLKAFFHEFGVFEFKFCISAFCLEEMAEVYERVELVMPSPSKFHPRRNRLLFTVVVRFFLVDRIIGSRIERSCCQFHIINPGVFFVEIS